MIRKSAPDVPASDVLAALERICASEQFSSAPQLQRFLRFVVNAALQGEFKSIKAYTIAVGALGRPEDFDPDKNSIVRVEAARLRRTLDDYYSAHGAADEIRIVLPVGQYVPAFERCGTIEAAEPAEDVAAVEQAPPPAHRLLRGPWKPLQTLWTVVATVVVIAALEILVDIDHPLHLAVHWIRTH